MPQMVERPWGVTAHGASSVQAVPDLVRVQFRVTELAPDPPQAFAAAGQSVRAVRDTLRRHGVPDSGVQGSRLTLRTSWSGYGEDRKFLGYQCQASFVVESRDLDRLEPLIIDLVAAGANEVESVDFDVSAKPQLRAEARRKAVAAAREKAQLYAEAAGVRLGPVIHIDDVDPERLANEGFRGHLGGAEASGGDWSPGNVVVSAAVVLGFSIVH